MANYRDDETSGIVASESYTAGWGLILQDVAITATAFMLATGGVFSDNAIAGDSFQLFQSSGVEDVIHISEAWRLTGARSQQVTDTAVGSDTLQVSALALVEDGATAQDAIEDRRNASVVEHVTVSDLLTDTKHSSRQMTDNLKVTDVFSTVTRKQVEDSAIASDSVVSRSVVKARIEETATASDSIDNSSQHGERLFDVAISGDAFKHHLSAKYQWADTAYAEDALQGEGTSSAWTANLSGYAVSRYSPYAFSSIAVVDGVLYGTRFSGVYRLDGVGSTEIVTAMLKTPSLDLSGDTLCYPNSVYLSYKTDGAVSLNVATSQSGQWGDYDYELPTEMADEMTTGRITLGRGLRGRYYRITLTTEATHFSAVELLATLDKSTRRI